LTKELEDKLHKEIPITKIMGLKLNSYNKDELLTSAPLDININDKKTAFGGSLNTITIISGWSMCWLISKELNINSNNIVIIKNQTSYLKPVKKNISCYTKKPSKEEISILKEKINKKNSASIKIVSKIIENNQVCVEFEGIYVIKL